MADDNSLSPMKDEHLEQIKFALDYIARAQPEIDKAKRAGIDVSQAEQQVNDARQKLLLLKNTYFPGR